MSVHHHRLGVVVWEWVIQPGLSLPSVADRRRRDDPVGNLRRGPCRRDAHTVWLDRKNKPAVIWAFRNAKIAHTGPVVDVATGQRSHANGRLEVTEGHVYQL